VGVLEWLGKESGCPGVSPGIPESIYCPRNPRSLRNGITYTVPRIRDTRPRKWVSRSFPESIYCPRNSGIPGPYTECVLRPPGFPDLMEGRSAKCSACCCERSQLFCASMYRRCWHGFDRSAGLGWICCLPQVLSGYGMQPEMPSTQKTVFFKTDPVMFVSEFNLTFPSISYILGSPL
jgi:hypothetical protein